MVQVHVKRAIQPKHKTQNSIIKMIFLDVAVFKDKPVQHDNHSQIHNSHGSLKFNKYLKSQPGEWYGVILKSSIRE